MLNGRGLGRVEERRGRGGAEEGQEAGDFFSSPPPPSSFIYQPVIPSPGVPFDSLQPCERLPIQDGGHNSRTKDYSALARHKIRLHCKLLHERCMRFFFLNCPFEKFKYCSKYGSLKLPSSLCGLVDGANRCIESLLLFAVKVVFHRLQKQDRECEASSFDFCCGIYAEFKLE